MFMQIEKSGTGINKSGTGINKSGTGIHRSGTGIHRSGTGIKKGGTGLRLPSLVLGLIFLASAFSGQAFAGDPDVLISERNDNLLISLHTENGIYMGATSIANGESGYFQVPLRAVAEATDQGVVFRTLVQGTGSGSASESNGAVGGSLMVKGTGSGSASDSVCGAAQTLVKGTGSGSASESAGSVGGSLMVKGTGSGNAGDASDDCISGPSFDLLAEVVVGDTGSHVLVTDQLGNERLVAFVAATSKQAPDRRDEVATRGFVAAP